MPRNIITDVSTQGIKGFDTNGNEFGIFYAQVCGVVKLSYGSKIQLECGAEIHLDICYNRLSTMMHRANQWPSGSV